jgi:ribulose-5-phosphate 4-epimerase/fuculose-1-phosphate aldolase
LIAGELEDRMTVRNAPETPSIRQRVGEQEWRARVELAAAYRLVAQHGWTNLINNHISLRVPGTEDQFLINPYGLLYEQITASSLVKIDVDGNILDETTYKVNRAGFVIHSAIHMARRDLHCRARRSLRSIAGSCRSTRPPCGSTITSAITTSKASRTTWTSASALSRISGRTSA